jgi:hypothetical protein
MDDAIFKKETEYLEDTPYGNILIGFDSYIKGSSSAAPGGGRRKAGVDDTNRVFSRSSVRYNDITVYRLFTSNVIDPQLADFVRKGFAWILILSYHPITCPNTYQYFIH